MPSGNPRDSGISNAHPLVSYLAGPEGKIECVHLARRGVNIVHRRRIAAPRDAVGDRHPGEDLPEGTVRIEAVQARATRLFVWGHRSDPQASGGIAFAVIGAVLGDVGFQGSKLPQLACFGIERCQPVRQGQEHPPALHGHDCADLPADLEAPVASRSRLVEIEPPILDVQPVQDLLSPIPEGPFAQPRVLFRDDVDPRIHGTPPPRPYF